jgi:hypothetical protein
VLALVAIPVLLHARSVVHDNATSSTFFATRDVRDALDAVSGVLGFFFMVAFAITVLWMIWMYRAAANAETFSLARQRFGKGFAIGGWFIPFANLVIPGLQMSDIWRGSPTPEAPHAPRFATALVWWWWIVFLAGRISFFALPGGVRLGRVYRLSDLDTRVTLSVVGNLFVALSAVLAILVVRSITAGQESGAARRRGPVAADPFTAMAAASPYPGPYAAPGPPATYPPQAYPPAVSPPAPPPPAPAATPPDRASDDDPPPPRSRPGPAPSDP